MSINEQKKVSEKAYPCGHCSNKALMYIISEGREQHSYEESDLDYTDTYVLKCPTCNQYNVIGVTHYIDRDYMDFKTTDMEGLAPSSMEYQYEHAMAYENAVYIKEYYLYPINRRIFRNLPEDVEKSYKTARKLLNIESLACAVFIGRTLEFLCKDRKATGKTLEKMLGSLKDRGEIPDRILDIANSLRFFRNIGALADSEMDITKRDAETLMTLCEAILEYVYEAPALLQAAQEKADHLKNGTKPKSTINLNRTVNTKRSIFLDGNDQ